MQHKPIRLFNYRPLVVVAGGMCMGVFFTRLLDNASLSVLTVAIFSFAAMILRKHDKYACFIAGFAFGALTVSISLLSNGVIQQHDTLMNVTLENVRNSIKQSIDTLFGESAGMVNAMLLGDREGIEYFTKSAYQVSGIAHILALSGLHISILAGALLFLIPASKPLLREIIVGTFLLLYCTLTNFPASLVRASIMMLCLLSAPIFSRRTDSLSSISAAAIVILTFSPDNIESIGFQLSFTAVIGITLLYSPIKNRIDFFGSTLSSAIAVSLSATLGTMPLMLYHFSRISVYALLANIIILPMVSIALISAVLTVCFYIVSPVIAEITAFIPRMLFSAITYFAKAISALPYSEISLPCSSIVFTLICYVVMVIISPYCFADKKRKIPYCCIGLIIGISLFVLQCSLPK